MALNGLFNKELKVINVGLELFFDDLNTIGCNAVQTNWSVPSHKDERVKNLLKKFRKLDEK